MIAIFGSKTKVSTKSNRRKKKKKLDNLAKDNLGKENLSKLNPMAFGIIAVKSNENPSNEFLSSSRDVIMDRPYLLTDKWINSINKFVASAIEAALLDPPSISEGERVSFDNLVVAKYVPAKEFAEYPMPAIICVDERGWKFYFKTSKASSFPTGSTISFKATVSAHKEGITFLRRPSKITKVDDSLNK